MTLIDMFRGFLFALGRHLGWIAAARNTTWTELLALNVVFGAIRLNTIWLAVFSHANLLGSFVG